MSVGDTMAVVIFVAIVVGLIVVFVFVAFVVGVMFMIVVDILPDVVECCVAAEWTVAVTEVNHAPLDTVVRHVVGSCVVVVVGDHDGTIDFVVPVVCAIVDS